MNSPRQIAQNFAELGVKKASAPLNSTYVLAVLAGMFIAFAGVASTVAGAAVNRLAAACVFPAGLAMVVVAGSELFTGDNLMIVSLLDKKITAGRMLLTLLVVYFGNYLGAFLVALLAVSSGALSPFAESVVATAAAKVSLTFVEALIRGVMCNILVCIAVWMAAAAQTPGGKIAALYGPIMVFVLSGYEHCVANMYYLPAGLVAAVRYGIPAEGLTWGASFLKNLLPVTLGNILGGFAVGALYWSIYLKQDTKQTV